MICKPTHEFHTRAPWAPLLCHTRRHARRLALVLTGAVFFSLTLAAPTQATQQTLVLKLKQPLRAEAVKVRVPGAQNQRGERRDLETVIDLGPTQIAANPKTDDAAADVLTLGLNARVLGKSSLLVSFTLPKAGFVEIALLDFYGKTVATVTADPFLKGRHVLPPFPFQQSEQNGVRFLSLSIDGKVALRKMLPQVK
jgi:hypothetical protein